jgi:hypothetical protein
MILKSDPGKSIETPRWMYHYNTRPKPYFHPLRTPAGHDLSLFEPHDHLWQRGLWFAIKFVNGDNFWEENAPFGRQEVVSPLTITQTIDGAARFTNHLQWRRPNDNAVVIRERRTIYHRHLSNEAYVLDFQTILTPVVDVVLDRTPYTTWGGYGGLAFRGTRNWEETRLLFADGTVNNQPAGLQAPWCDLSGVLDGGYQQTGGLALFDHPDNPRHPTPWYGDIRPGYHFFNAAFLFDGPAELAVGERLTLRYGVLVHDGIWEMDRLQAAYDAFMQWESPV